MAVSTTSFPKSAFPRTAFGLCVAAAFACWLLSSSFPALARWPQYAIWQLGESLNGLLNHLLREVTVHGRTVTDYSRELAGVFAFPVNWLIEAMIDGHFYDTPWGEFWLAPPPRANATNTRARAVPNQGGGASQNSPHGVS